MRYIEANPEKDGFSTENINVNYTYADFAIGTAEKRKKACLYLSNAFLSQIKDRINSGRYTPVGNINECIITLDIPFNLQMTEGKETYMVCLDYNMMDAITKNIRVFGCWDCNWSFVPDKMVPDAGSYKLNVTFQAPDIPDFN